MSGPAFLDRWELIRAALEASAGNRSAAARRLGIRRTALMADLARAKKMGLAVPAPAWSPGKGEAKPPTFFDPRLGTPEQIAESLRPLTAGSRSTREVQVRPLPPKGRVHRYLCTAATNNTDVHPEFWANLLAFARVAGAEILIRRIGYNLAAYRRLGPDTELPGEGDGREVYFDPALTPYFCDDRVELAPGLHYAGDAPVTATAASPLSGYESFTGPNSAIFGATKLEMRSVATMRGVPAKLLYTTGAVTQRAYTETKTGQKADWHHTYGASLVEVDHDGDWFVRPIVAHDDGTFHDLTLKAEGGEVTGGHRVAGWTPGDIHVMKLDPEVERVLFGKGGLTDVLRPREMHLHDLHDHGSASHHDRRDPFRQYALRIANLHRVQEEVRADAAFLTRSARRWMRSIVVASNHDDHLRRSVAEIDWRADLDNAPFFLEAALATLAAIDRKDDGFVLLEWACRREGVPATVQFLAPDASHVLEGIEMGLHGDRGPNGARGSRAGLARVGMKVTIGHSHSPGIQEGCWQTGVTAGSVGSLDMGYNTGPSSWSRSGVVTYPGGKRTMITMRGLKWRAMPPIRVRGRANGR